MSKSYTVGPITAYAIAVKHGYSGSETEWLASLKGATGPQGIQGIRGEQGIQGPAGPKGDSYTLTAADKQEIAQTVLHELPIPEAVTEQTVAGWGFAKSTEIPSDAHINGLIDNKVVDKYTLPTGGIPESDLSASVQEKLNQGGGGGGAEWKTQAYDFSADYAANVELILPSNKITEASLYVTANVDALASGTTTTRVFINKPENNQNFNLLAIMGGTHTSSRNSTLFWKNALTGVTGGCQSWWTGFNGSTLAVSAAVHPSDRSTGVNYATNMEKLYLVADSGNLTGTAYLVYREAN